MATREEAMRAARALRTDALELCDRMGTPPTQVHKNYRTLVNYINDGGTKRIGPAHHYTALLGHEQCEVRCEDANHWRAITSHDTGVSALFYGRSGLDVEEKCWSWLREKDAEVAKEKEAAYDAKEVKQ